MRWAPVPVDLADAELQWAADVSKVRHDDSVAKGYEQKHGCSESEGVVDYIGACGELAFCKAMGLYWEARIGNFKEADVGVDIQVRTAPSKLKFAPHNFGRLIVRPADTLAHRFVLVTGNPPHFFVKGWILGENAQRDEWWCENVADRPPAWFVPWRALNRELESLIGCVVCNAPGVYAYTRSSGLVWFCVDHRIAQWWADERRRQ
jgi:hypothetical protein